MVTEDAVGEIAKFNSLYGMDLTSKDDHYTFLALKDAPEYSVVGKTYLNLVATKTYAGNPWEVFAENSFIYDFSFKILRPIVSVVNQVNLVRALSFYYTKGLVLPGSVTSDNKKITGYQCRFDFKTLNFNYSEVYYA